MTLQELRQRQAWTLHQKVDHTLGVIDQFVSRMDGKVYLAFSGGKDSTVLMHLCEMIKPDIQCVFVNTGCESPSILQFVRKKKEEGHNIITIRPKMTPRDVWAKYGFPLVGKETAECIHAIRTNPDSIKSKKALGDTDPDSMFVLSRKWKYLLVTKYETSNLCCRVLKKEPSHRFARESGLAPIVGTMASESLLREKTYIRRGGVTCSITMRYPFRLVSGTMLIYGILFMSAISRLQTYTAMAQVAQGVLHVVSDVSLRMTPAWNCCIGSIPSTTIW